MRKQAVFQALVQAVRDTRQNRMNKDVAYTYRFDRLRRSTLNALRSYGLQSRRMKCITGAAMFQRLVPKAFACLQMHVRVKCCKRSMETRANEMYQQRLIGKSMSALNANVTRKQGKHKNNKIADAYAKT